MSERKKEIDFLIIGVQKSATSWLYDCINEHPQICVPKYKKEVEYIGGELYNKNGLEWYFSLLDHCGTDSVKGDVSVEYMYNKHSAELIKKFIPNVKLIVSLRNPVERAISAYYWYLRKGLISSERSMIETFKYLKKNYQEGNKNAEGIDIIERGMYHEQLESYLNYFDKSQLLILLYEEIKLNPGSVLKKIFSFLNVDENFVPKSILEKPKQNSYSNWIIKFERLNPNSRLIAGIADKINHLLLSNANRQKIPPQELEGAAILSDLYDSSINKTKVIIESFPAWRQPQMDISKVWRKIF
jgi:hypothetical protein